MNRNDVMKISRRLFLSDEGVTNFVKRVNESTTITTLDFHSVEIAPERLKKLCDEITNPRLTTLKLCCGRIGNEGVKRIATNLPNLTTLDVSNNEVGNEGAIAISSMTKLTTLDLNNNSIDNEGTIALSKLPNLESLDLSVNDVGDEGAIALSSMTKLRTLELSFNDVGDEGAIAISSTKSLRTLNLTFNDIGNDGAATLMKIPKLTSLRLYENSEITIWDELLSAFESHPTMFDVSFDVWLNDITRIDEIKNRKRMRAFREVVKSLNDNVTSKIFKYL